MCVQCNFTGMILAMHREDKSVFGFRCECRNAEKVSRHIPAWKPIRLKEFDPGFNAKVTPKITTPEAPKKKPDDEDEGIF